MLTFFVGYILPPPSAYGGLVPLLGGHSPKLVRLVNSSDELLSKWRLQSVILSESSSDEYSILIT